MPIQLIKEYIKLLGMTVVFTLGQAFAFGIVLPLWAVLINAEKGGNNLADKFGS